MKNLMEQIYAMLRDNRKAIVPVIEGEYYNDGDDIIDDMLDALPIPGVPIELEL